MIDGSTDGISFPFLRRLWQIVAIFYILIQISVYWLTLEGAFSFADREFENYPDVSILPFEGLLPLLNGDMWATEWGS